MALTTNEGLFIEVLDCERMKLVVVAADKEGNQALNPQIRDWVFEPKAFPGAPEGCPMLSESAQRQLGDFAICNSCIYSMIKVVGE